MKTIQILSLVILLAIFVAGCSQTKYVCPDGKTVSNRYQCSENSSQEDKSLIDKAITKVSFNENKEKEKIEKLINEHFDAINWKDEEAYLNTIDEHSEEFYTDRTSFFRKNVKDGSSSFTINVSSVETQITPDNASSKIRLIIIVSSTLLGEVEQKNTIFYKFNKIGDEWKISGFDNQDETSSVNVPMSLLNVTQLNCRIGEYGWAEIIGQVTNIGDETGYNVKVYIDLKRDGQVVETGFTYVNGDNIPPGQSKSFEKTFIDPETWDSCSAYATE